MSKIDQLWFRRDNRARREDVPAPATHAQYFQLPKARTLKVCRRNPPSQRRHSPCTVPEHTFKKRDQPASGVSNTRFAGFRPDRTATFVQKLEGPTIKRKRQAATTGAIFLTAVAQQAQKTEITKASSEEHAAVFV